MRNLIFLFLGLVVLKVFSLTLRVIDAKERVVYTDFYDAEIYRKYKEHNLSYSALKEFNYSSTLIPNEIKDLMNRNDTDNVNLVFNRKWFQDYLHELNENFPSANLSTLPTIEDFPELMKNTVLEEHAENEIYNLYNKNGWFESVDIGELKGMIRNIETHKDTTSVDIIAFWYNPKELFKECVREFQTIPIKSNPFYHKGPLDQWTCKYLHPVTMVANTMTNPLWHKALL